MFVKLITKYPFLEKLFEIYYESGLNSDSSYLTYKAFVREKFKDTDNTLKEEIRQIGARVFISSDFDVSESISDETRVELARGFENFFITLRQEILGLYSAYPRFQEKRLIDYKPVCVQISL